MALGRCGGSVVGREKLDSRVARRRCDSTLGEKTRSFHHSHIVGLTQKKQVKPGFTNYQPQPKYSWVLSKIEGKGKSVKTKGLRKGSEKLENSEDQKIRNF